MSARKNSITAPDIRRQHMQPMGYGKVPLHRQTDGLYVPWAVAWLVELRSLLVMPQVPAVSTLLNLALVILTSSAELPPVGESVLHHPAPSAVGNPSAGEPNRKYCPKYLTHQELHSSPWNKKYLRSSLWNKKYLRSSTTDKKFAIHVRSRMDAPRVLTWMRSLWGIARRTEIAHYETTSIACCKLLKIWLEDPVSTKRFDVFSRGFWFLVRVIVVLLEVSFSAITQGFS